MIDEKDLDILCMTETWLWKEGDEPVIKDIVPPGYDQLHHARSHGKGRGGGVMIVFRKSILMKECKHRQWKNFENIEATFPCGKRTIRLVCVYRPPPSDENEVTVKGFFEDFEPFLSSGNLPSENIIVVGDLNFHVNDPTDSNARRLIRLYEPLGFEQLVNEPTQTFGNTLDLALVRCRKLVTSVSVEKNDLSDHFLVTLGTDLSRPRVPRKTILCRNIASIDMSRFTSDLINSTLVRNPPDDLCALVSMYNSYLLNLLDTYAPQTKKSVPDRQNSEWFNDDVLKAKRARRRAERKKRKSGLTVHIQAYNKAKIQVNKVSNIAKITHYHSEFEKASTDNKKTFSLLDTLLGEQDRSSVCPDLNDTQAAANFSDFFSCKISRIRASLDVSASQMMNNNHVVSNNAVSQFTVFKPLSQEDVRRLVTQAKPTSCLLDPLPTKLTIELLDILLPVIQKIVNLSLDSGTVPLEFKKAVVRPLLKKSGLDRDELSNYRPVSNLSFISKILERAVSDQLVRYLDDNNLQEKFQSAYRPGHSCETALLRIVNDLFQIVDKGNTAILVLLDLSAAFDTIDHKLLLERLTSEFGITGRAIDWFESYLTSRTQKILVGTALSAEKQLVYGVPQGSVLGPLLFSLYTRQLANVIKRFMMNYHFFADDSQLYSAIPSNNQAAVSALQNVEACCLAVKEWMHQNKLKQNDQKTEVLVCGPRHRREDLPTQSIQVGDAEIQFSNVVKTLGVYLDADLSMWRQVSAMISGCNYHLRRIGRVRKCLTFSAARSAAVALVGSKLDYCNSLLHGVSKQRVKRLQIAQNSAARLVTRTKKRDHISPVLRELHWLPVEQRIEHKLLSLTYQASNNAAPEYLNELVEPYVPGRVLRSGSKKLLCVPGKKDALTKSFGERAFSFAGPSLWKPTPLSLKLSASKASFKANCKTLLFRRAFD
jgi:hypothetical protein